MKALFVWFIGICAMLCAFTAQAQDNACFTFVGDSVGCAPFTAKVQSCGRGPALYYQVLDPQGAPVAIPRNPRNALPLDSFTFSNPGRYTVVQGTGGNPDVRLVRYVVVLPQGAIRFTVKPCREKRISIVIQQTEGDRFRVDMGDGTVLTTPITAGPVVRLVYQYAPTRPTQNTVRISSLYPCTSPAVRNVRIFDQIESPDSVKVWADPGQGQARFFIKTTVYPDSVFPYDFTIKRRIGSQWVPQTVSSGTRFNEFIATWTATAADSVPRFRIVWTDPCGFRLDSSEVQHARLYAQTQPVAGTINLRWLRNNIVTYFNRYELQRQPSRVVDIVNRLDTTLIDNTVNCNVLYTYQVVHHTRYPGPTRPTNLAVYSNSRSLVAVARQVPQTPSWLLVTAQDPDAKVVWRTPVGFKAKTWQAVVVGRPGKPDSLIYSGGDTVQIHREAAPQRGRVCYQVSFQDECDNQSARSRVVCSIFLTARQTGPVRYELTWTPYEGFLEGVDYYVLEYLDENGSVFKSRRMVAQTPGLPFYTFVDEGRTRERQLLRYRMRAVPLSTLNNPEPAYSNRAELQQTSLLRLPDAFSPNGDGVNDVFRPENAHFRSYELRVYNRWGQLVFFTADPGRGWDGTYENKAAPVDVYSVLVKGEDESGRSFEERATVTLVR